MPVAYMPIAYMPVACMPVAYMNVAVIRAGVRAATWGGVPPGCAHQNCPRPLGCAILESWMGAVSTKVSRLGPYVLGKRLGTGGMAEVYEAHREGPHGFSKRFAIKRILPQLSADARFVAMFCDEARICAALTHPNIVQVVDFGESAGDLFMAMEYVEGISVAKLLRYVAGHRQKVPLPLALFIVHEVLRGLSFAHEACDPEGRPLGIIHRDVSPGNVLVSSSGEVKLTDFGIVRSAFVDRRTYPGELKGKMGYMSPEQVIGKDVDPRSDLFTLGIVLAELLVMRPMFPGKSEVEVLTKIYQTDLSVLDCRSDHLPPSVLKLVRKALARVPGERFQSARDFDEALLRVAVQEGIPLRAGDLAVWVTGLGVLRTRSSTRASGTLAKVEPGRDTVPTSKGGSREAGKASLTRQKVPGPQSVSPPAKRIPFPACQERRFKLRDNQGGQSRSVSTVQLLQLLATGQVSPVELVTERRKETKPLREVEGLGAIVARPAYAFGEIPAAPPSLDTPIERDKLPAVLYRLSLDGRTGMLAVASETGHRRIFYQRGVPAFASSTNPEELLGHKLVRMGALTKDDLYQALELSCLQERHLGEVLLKYGVLRPSMLLRALIEQLEERFGALGSLSSGRLTFHNGIAPGEELPRTPQEGLAFVTRLVRDGYGLGELGKMFRPFNNAVVRRDSDSPLDLTRLGVTRAERCAIELAPALHNLTSAMQELKTDRIATPVESLRGIFIGLSVGAIQMDGW